MLRPKVQEARDPPRPTPESRRSGSPRSRLGAPSSRGPSALHRAPAPPARRAVTGLWAARPLTAGQIAGGFLAADNFPVFCLFVLFLKPLLCCFPPFLSIKVAAVRRGAGGPEEARWLREVAAAAGYLTGAGRTRRCVRSGLSLWKFNYAAVFFQTEPGRARPWTVPPPPEQFPRSHLPSLGGRSLTLSLQSSGEDLLCHLVSHLGDWV